MTKYKKCLFKCKFANLYYKLYNDQNFFDFMIIKTMKPGDLVKYERYSWGMQYLL